MQIQEKLIKYWRESKIRHSKVQKENFPETEVWNHVLKDTDMRIATQKDKYQDSLVWATRTLNYWILRNGGKILWTYRQDRHRQTFSYRIRE